MPPGTSSQDPTQTQILHFILPGHAACMRTLLSPSDNTYFGYPEVLQHFLAVWEEVSKQVRLGEGRCYAVGLGHLQL